MTDFERDQMIVELERLRRENVRLQRVAGRRAAYEAKVHRAHGDAVLMLSLRAGGITPSRQYCADKLHIGRRRWQWGVALLKQARLYKRGVVDQTLAMIRLDEARREVLAAPILLRKNLSKHGRDEWSYKNRGRVRQDG